MSVLATLEPHQLSVEPGGEATATLSVRNQGPLVEQYTVEVLGDAARLVTVEPPVSSLFPGGAGQVVLRFRPPRAATTPAGPLVYGVRVLPSQEPQYAVVEEGTVVIGGFVETTAELVPRISRGRRAARFEIAVDNRGNQAVPVSFIGNQPDNLLGFAFAPPSVSAAPGTATFVRLRTRPVKRFWTGKSKTHPFAVVAQPEGAPPMNLDGSMLQEPLLPGWLPAALAALVALAVVLLVLWLSVVKPAIKSAAKDEVSQQLNPSPSPGVSQAPNKPAGSGGGGGGGGGGSATPTPGASGGTSTALGDPVDGRLAATAPSGGTNVAPAAVQVPPKNTLSITDIVLENPQGDGGTLVIKRNAAVLLQEQMSNYRDLDLHFVAPLTFHAGDTLSITITGCVPGAPATTCQDGLFYAGFNKVSP